MMRTLICDETPPHTAVPQKQLGKSVGKSLDVLLQRHKYRRELLSASANWLSSVAGTIQGWVFLFTIFHRARGQLHKLTLASVIDSVLSPRNKRIKLPPS